MKISRWLSDTSRRLSRRERAVVLGGAAISGMALAWAYGIVPAAARWREREAAIAVRAEQLARLRALVALDTVVRQQTVTLTDQAARARGQLLGGATPALAASALQVLLGQYAERSGVSLERVDVAGIPIPSDSLVPVPARITARGDLAGLVDLLFYVQHGEPLLVIDDLRVQGHPGGATGAGELTWMIALHGYHLADSPSEPAP
jgi:type II secretory pathway component PulM